MNMSNLLMEVVDSHELLIPGMIGQNFFGSKVMKGTVLSLLSDNLYMPHEVGYIIIVITYMCLWYCSSRLQCPMSS